MSSYVSNLMLKSYNSETPSTSDLKKVLGDSNRLPEGVLSSLFSFSYSSNPCGGVLNMASKMFEMRSSAAITIQSAVRYRQPATELNVTIMTPGGTRPPLELLDSLTIREVIQSFANAEGENNSRFSLFFEGEEEKLDEDITLKEFMQVRALSGINLNFFALPEPTDKEVLLRLLEADGPWAEADLNWKQEPDMNQWNGIELNEAGQVVSLDLKTKNLSGRIPRELGQLRALTTLVLARNQLTGPIPAELGHLHALNNLALSYNQLEGPIPAELGQLHALSSLNLSHNQLEGPIPAELGQLHALTALNLFNNQLTGPIPQELGQLRALSSLNLFSNQLSGPIPAELGQLSQLKNLYLSHNQLEGPIPAELGQLHALTALNLFNNQLEGPIPAELGQLHALTELDLFFNQLTGPIPEELEVKKANGQLDVRI